MAPEASPSRFIVVLNKQGGSAGNIRMREILGWKAKTYARVRDELALNGVITKGRGRGGSVSLMSNTSSNENSSKLNIVAEGLAHYDDVGASLTATPELATTETSRSKSNIKLKKIQKLTKTVAIETTMTKVHATTAYQTAFGEMIHGSIEDALLSRPLNSLEGKVNLIVTSPPFPLVRKKKYGNKTGENYVEWLRTLARSMSDLLTDNGSIVIEIGNAWEEGAPVMSTLPIEALLAFKQAAHLHLCQHIICHNPARLPSPAAWVNVNRIRLKDSYTHVWWMSKSKYPKADNRKVLNPYSSDMKRLLKSQSYNAGVRPSGHVISPTGFLKDHGGSIGPNVLDLTGEHYPDALLKFTGTKWDSDYRGYCKKRGMATHPARMQSALAAFFIQFLTDESDLVLDPFAGSNTTGSVAEEMGRKWIGVEANEDYITGSRGRFSVLRKQDDDLDSGNVDS